LRLGRLSAPHNLSGYDRGKASTLPSYKDNVQRIDYKLYYFNILIPLWIPAFEDVNISDSPTVLEKFVSSTLWAFSICPKCHDLVTSDYIRQFKIAVRNLLRNRSRTLVAVLTVASGVAAYLVAGGFIAWIFHDMRDATIHSQLGHAQVVRPGYFQKGIADPYAFMLPAMTGDERVLAGIPGVVSVSPRLGLSGLISHDEITLPFGGEGIDPVAEQPLNKRVRILEGRDLGGLEQRQVLVGEGLARSLHARVGDTVVLLTKTVSGSAGAIELVVSGIFATVVKEYDDSAIRVPISVARKLMRVEGATSWVVLLDSDEQTETFVGSARSILSPREFEVVPWSNLADFYNKTVVLFSKQVSVIEIIIGLIIALTIGNTLTMSVLERTVEIGTSLAIGVGRGTIMRIFLLESLLIGTLGGCAGILLGWSLAMLVSSIGIPMPPPPGMAHGYVAQIIVTRELVLNGVMLALVSTSLASILPAWKAGRMNIVDALRYGQ